MVNIEELFNNLFLSINNQKMNVKYSNNLWVLISGGGTTKLIFNYYKYVDEFITKLLNLKPNQTWPSIGLWAARDRVCWKGENALLAPSGNRMSKL